MRAAPVVAALVLVLAGCSGSDEPDAASKDDFCEEFNTLVDDVLGAARSSRSDLSTDLPSDLDPSELESMLSELAESAGG